MATNNTADAAASRSGTATPVPNPAAGFLGPRAPSQMPSASSSEASALSQMSVSPLTPQVPSSTPKTLSETPVEPPVSSLFPVKLASSDTNSGSAAAPKSWKELAKNVAAVSQAQPRPQPAVPLADLKRKVTDPHLKIVTIDPFYDLTVIVGTPSSIGSQTAFRVNKGSLRHASEVWTKALTGHWGARLGNQSEIEFPEDSPWAFEQVLRIAHWQIRKLPLQLTITELKSLATLSDKYDLGGLMKMALDSGRWLHPVRYYVWRQWPAQSSLREWTFITHALQSRHDYEYLISRLAVEVQVDATDVSFYYVTGEGKTKLGDLPDRILDDIDNLRTSIIQDWILICKNAIGEAIQQSEVSSGSCSNTTCRHTKIGIVMAGLQAAGFHPVPEHAHTMYQSVVWYWRTLKNIGAKFRPYQPGGDAVTCSFEKCLGDFGILTRAEATLRKNGHRDVANYLLSSKFLKGPAGASVA